MKCLITGCALIREGDDAVVWGDLFEVGDTYVFNACLNHGEAAWQFYPDNNVPLHIKSLTCDDRQFFERRGVIVVAKANASLNQAAKDYIK